MKHITIKRSVSLAAAAVLCAGLLSGCSDGTNPGGKGGNDGEEITLTVTVNRKELGNPDIFKKYEDEHPNINISEQPVASNDTKLLAMITSGQAPDIIRVVGVDDLPAFVSRGLLMPLDDMVAQSEVLDLEDLYEVNSLFRFDGTTIGQGPLYGVVKDWSYDSGIWINKNVFNSAGIPLPEADKPYTYEEFAQIANRLVIKEGNTVKRVGFISASPISTLAEMKLASVGKSIWSEDFKSTTLTSADTRAAFEYWHDLQMSGAMASALYSVTDNRGYTYLANDQVGMVMCGYWMVGNLRQAGYSEDIFDKLMYIPGLSSSGGLEPFVLSATGASIFSDTQYPEEAYELWEYLMTAEDSSDYRAKLGFGIPAFKSKFDLLPKTTTLDQTVLATLDKEFEAYETKQLKVRTNPYISYTSLLGLFDRYYTPVLFGQSTLTDALASIDQETQLLISEGLDLIS